MDLRMIKAGDCMGSITLKGDKLELIGIKGTT